MGKMKRMSAQKALLHKSMALAAKWKDCGSFTDGVKQGFSTYSGGTGKDKFTKQIGLVTNSSGQYTAVANNGFMTGSTGIVQPGRPRVLYDFVVNGWGYSAYQVVPFDNEVIPAAQIVFNWVLMYLPAGIRPDDALSYMTPPTFTPSIEASGRKITLEKVGPGGTYLDEQGTLTYADVAKTNAKKVPQALMREYNEEAVDSSTKRLKSTPSNTVSVASIMAVQPVVSEIMLPRQNLIMSGTGVCIYNSSTVTNCKIKAYSSERIHTKQDDMILFMVKTAGETNYVSVVAQVSYKESF